jgi:hypothetical protein
MRATSLSHSQGGRLLRICGASWVRSIWATLQPLGFAFLQAGDGFGADRIGQAQQARRRIIGPLPDSAKLVSTVLLRSRP